MAQCPERAGRLEADSGIRKGAAVMRRFRDRQGRAWDVVLGRASWGVHCALFVPVGTTDQPVRQAPLAAVAFDAGMQELDALDDAGLQELLDRSTIKDEGSA
jgi:hypothetical protein